MPTDSQSPSDELRAAVESLPRRTRVAMLRGIERNTIITGAYSDPQGGVCPMLAAHRCGGRTDFVNFAAAWDAFTGIMAGRLRRPATDREIGELVAHLEHSLYGGEGETGDLREAISEHQQMFRTRHAREASEVGSQWLHEELLTVPDFVEQEPEPEIEWSPAPPPQRRRNRRTAGV